MWALRIVLLSFPVDSFPRNCFFMKLHPPCAQQINVQSKHLRGPLGRLMELFSLHSSLVSRSLLLKTEPSWPPPAPIFASSTQWGQMALFGIPLPAQRSENSSLEESWVIKELNLFAPPSVRDHGSAVPIVQISENTCFMYFVQFPICLWLVGKFRMLLPHSQKPKSWFLTIKCFIRYSP